MIQTLLVPRRITHLLLIAAGVLLGQCAWLYLDAKLLAYLSGVAAPFCLLCAGAVWAMRDKADDILEVGVESADDYERTRSLSNLLRRNFTPRAAFVAVLALLAGSAATSLQLAGAVWHWMALLTGFAVGESAFSYLLANSWEEQMRAFRAKRVLSSMRDTELLAAVDKIRNAEPLRAESLRPWQRSTDELRPSSSTSG